MDVTIASEVDKVILFKLEPFIFDLAVTLSKFSLELHVLTQLLCLVIYIN